MTITLRSRRPRHAAALGLALACGALIACGKADDGAPEPPPPPLDLAGARVMLLPARPGAPPELDRELVFWLTDRAPGTDWIRPDEIERTVAANPASNFDLRGPRRVVDVGGGELRVRDPLYGDLRRLGAILDAPLALVPIGTRASTDSLGVTVRLTAVLVSIRGGRVLWMHTVHGGPTRTAANAVAGAAETLARTLIRQEG